jgi:hypothetical protein
MMHLRHSKMRRESPSLLKGASCNTGGDENLLLDTATKQVATTAVRKDSYELEDEDDDEDEDHGEESGLLGKILRAEGFFLFSLLLLLY